MQYVLPSIWSTTSALCLVAAVLWGDVQDASTASLVWVLTLMAEHPDVLERVRTEQLAARPDLSATITGETLAQMPYTRQVRRNTARITLPGVTTKGVTQVTQVTEWP